METTTSSTTASENLPKYADVPPAGNLSPPRYCTYYANQAILEAYKIADLNATIQAKQYEVIRARKRKKRAKGNLKHLEKKLRHATKDERYSGHILGEVKEMKRKLEQIGREIGERTREKRELVAQSNVERRRAMKILVLRDQEWEREDGLARELDGISAETRPVTL